MISYGTGPCMVQWSYFSFWSYQRNFSVATTPVWLQSLLVQNLRTPIAPPNMWQLKEFLTPHKNAFISIKYYHSKKQHGIWISC